MALKDFSFAQLDKKARLSVGKLVKKSDKENSTLARVHCAGSRSCITYSH